MIAEWMLYSLVISIVLAGAGCALERLLRLWGRGVRWIWLAVLAGSVTWPILLWLFPGGFANGGSGARADAAAHGFAAAEMLMEPVRVVLQVPESMAWLDMPILAIWAAASLFLLIRLAVSGARIARDRDWRPGNVDGVPVLVSRNLGPAVLGPLRSEIVLPCWALGLDTTSRALLLAHERQHQVAGDAWPIFASRIVPALLPWHAIVWWQARRLRLAVECDCDARVLAAGGFPSMDSASLEVANAMRFEPAPNEDRAVGVIASIAIAFKVR